MKEILRIPNGIVPCHAEGHYCIDLTDPITGKVKERVNGKNHIFEDSLFSGSNMDWITSISAAYMVLSDSTYDIDADVPYVLGQAIGFGIPSNSGSGTYRGAYNATNQKLAQMTQSSVRWKFQYDFTTAQANGTINTIGLTHQYSSSNVKRMIKDFRAPAYSQTYAKATCDGRYSYSCTTAGVITKYDNYYGIATTIDVSAITGTDSSSYKEVGYASATGLYYIYVYSSTASLRKMYVFTDNTFSTLSATYSPSNVALSMADGLNYPMYIYGNYAFVVSSGSMYIADFVNNVAHTTQNLNCYSNVIGGISFGYLNYGTVAHGKYIFMLCSYSNSYSAYIYDLSAQEIVGYSMSSNTSILSAVAHPLANNFLPCNSYYGILANNCAIAAKKLDAPVTKTSANGLTVTYELEVFW